jgi:hypothetical protein
MSGILDSRKRIMDTIVTLEGRKQIADGKLKIEYISFTDSSTFYSADAISGSADVTTRLYFEQCHLPQDQITFEADDSGKLKPFKNASEIDIYGGKISKKVVKQTLEGSSREETVYLTGSQFASTSESLLNSSIDNYKKLYVLGTKDYLFEDDGFGIGNNELEFKILKNNPISSPQFYEKSLSDMPSLFNDKLLSNVLNFKFLPPINKIQDETIDKSSKEIIEANKIGDYQPLNQAENYTFVQLEDDLANIEKLGYKKTIVFDPTSLNNKLVSQFFEVNEEEMKKLDIIDYGSYRYKNKVKQAFFIGKVLLDDNGTNTFVRLFTVVFE